MYCILLCKHMILSSYLAIDVLINCHAEPALPQSCVQADESAQSLAG